MTALPRVLKLPIVIGAIREEAHVPEEAKELLGAHRWHHVMAFAYCLARADAYIRDFGLAQENAVVFCEDVPEMRKLLDAMRTVVTKHPTYMPREELLDLPPQGVHFKIERIIEPVAFAPKRSMRSLQLADACAF